MKISIKNKHLKISIGEVIKMMFKKGCLEKAVVLGLVLACPYNAVYAADYAAGVNWNSENNRTIDDNYDISHGKSVIAISLGRCTDIVINSKEVNATVIGDDANIVQGLSSICSDVTVADGIKITSFIQSDTSAGLRAFGVDLIGTNADPNKLVLGKNTVINVEALGGIIMFMVFIIMRKTISRWVMVHQWLLKITVAMLMRSCMMAVILSTVM